MKGVHLKRRKLNDIHKVGVVTIQLLHCFFTVIVPDCPRNSLENSQTNYMKWTAITAHDN